MNTSILNACTYVGGVLSILKANEDGSKSVLSAVAIPEDKLICTNVISVLDTHFELTITKKNKGDNTSIIVKLDLLHLPTVLRYSWNMNASGAPITSTKGTDRKPVLMSKLLFGDEKRNNVKFKDGDKYNLTKENIWYVEPSESTRVRTPKKFVLPFIVEYSSGTFGVEIALCSSTLRLGKFNDVLEAIESRNAVLTKISDGVSIEDITEEFATVTGNKEKYVSFNKNSGKWKVVVHNKGNNTYLGEFAEIADAVAKRDEFLANNQ